MELGGRTLIVGGGSGAPSSHSAHPSAEAATSSSSKSTRGTDARGGDARGAHKEAAPPSVDHQARSLQNHGLSNLRIRPVQETQMIHTGSNGAVFLKAQRV